MPYATTSDVNALLPPAKGQLGASSVPTATQVTAWIAEFEAELNGLLVAAGFTAPVTGSNDLIRVRRIIVEATACKVWPVMFPADDSALPSQVGQWCSTWANTVAALKDGSFTLVDQSRRKKTRVIYMGAMGDDD